MIYSSIVNAALFNPKEGVKNLDLRSFNSHVLKDEVSDVLLYNHISFVSLISPSLQLR